MILRQLQQPPVSIPFTTTSGEPLTTTTTNGEPSATMVSTPVSPATISKPMNNPQQTENYTKANDIISEEQKPKRISYVDNVEVVQPSTETSTTSASQQPKNHPSPSTLVVPGGSLAANNFKQRAIHGQQSEGKTSCSAEGY